MAYEYGFEVRRIKELPSAVVPASGRWPTFPRRWRAGQPLWYPGIPRRRRRRAAAVVVGMVSVSLLGLRRYRFQRSANREFGKHPFFAVRFLAGVDLKLVGKPHFSQLEKDELFEWEELRGAKGERKDGFFGQKECRMKKEKGNMDLFAAVCECVFF